MRTEELLALGMFGRGSRLRERVEMLLERGRDFSPRVSRVRVAASSVLLLGCVIGGAFAPRWIAFAQALPEFEVATIKPGSPETHGTMTSAQPGKLTLKNITLREAVRMAYRLNEPELFGGPKWVDSEHYDIDGRAESRVPRDQIILMLQSLLADRFQLRWHRDTKDGPVYLLQRGKNALRLEEPKDKNAYHWAGGNAGGSINGDGLAGMGVAPKQKRQASPYQPGDQGVSYGRSCHDASPQTLRPAPIAMPPAMC